MRIILALVLAYLLGSIPSSYLVGRLAGGVDLRQHGSRNLGATNVFRVLGWKYAIPVLLLDAAKGTVAAVVVAPWAGPQPWMPLVVGTAAVLGHVFTVFLGFRGGKGVATAAGVLLGVAPVAIGDDAYVATATTVRRDVRAGALVFNPRDQAERRGWVADFRARKTGKKVTKPVPKKAKSSRKPVRKRRR